MRGQSSAKVGAFATSASVMPCFSDACGSMGMLGLTNDPNWSTICPSRTRTTAISTISHLAVSRPVVSRSMAVKSENFSAWSAIDTSCSALNRPSAMPREGVASPGILSEANDPRWAVSDSPERRSFACGSG